MCKPADVEGPVRVVVAGAGPAGCLAAIHLLRRNAKENPACEYHVTLVDGGMDYGRLTQAELKKSHRSWMIGLASHGIEAIRAVPGLWDKYVSDVGVELTSMSMHLGAKEMKFSAQDEDLGENFIVDRNFVTAALARYLAEHHGDDSAFKAMYHTRVQYVDGPAKRLLVRAEDGSERYVEYDYILGCDGVRSAVRAAFVHHERTFEMEIGDIFAAFKAVHVPRPKTVNSASMHLLPDCFKECNGIALPETGDYLNVSVGIYHDHECPAELRSEDPAVVADYMRANFKAFDVDYDDWARQWVAQGWSTTGQVHCNFYHSNKLGAALLGDAAHATSPSIGMGMNTALADATCFNHLLDEHGDNWEEALPAYSKERVKEGNSLTWLAYYLYSFSPREQLRNTLEMLVRMRLHKWFPSLVLNDPQAIIGRKGVKLSQVYDTATKTGILKRSRAHNDAVRLRHFEKTTGMVTETPSSSASLVTRGVVVAAAAAAVLAFAVAPALVLKL